MFVHEGGSLSSDGVYVLFLDPQSDCLYSREDRPLNLIIFKYKI